MKVRIRRNGSWGGRKETEGTRGSKYRIDWTIKKIANVVRHHRLEYAKRCSAKRERRRRKDWELVLIGPQGSIIVKRTLGRKHGDAGIIANWTRQRKPPFCNILTSKLACNDKKGLCLVSKIKSMHWSIRYPRLYVPCGIIVYICSAGFRYSVYIIVQRFNQPFRDLSMEII